MRKVISPALFAVADDGRPIVFGLGDETTRWTESEFAATETDLDCVINFMASEPIVVMTTSGQRTIDAIRHVEQEVVSGNPTPLSLVDVLINLYAFLTSARALVDQCSGDLKRTFGAESPERTQFKRALSRTYDDLAEYLFFYALRNYAQHEAVPLSARPAASARLIDIDGNEQVESEFSVCCDRDALLAGGDWKAIVRDWLRDQPASFPIAPIVQVVLDALMSAAVEYHAARAAAVLAAHERLQPIWAAWERRPQPQASDHLGFLVVDPDAPSLRPEFVGVPVDRYTAMVAAAHGILAENPPTTLLLVCLPVGCERMAFG